MPCAISVRTIPWAGEGASSRRLAISVRLMRRPCSTASMRSARSTDWINVSASGSAGLCLPSQQRSLHPRVVRHHRRSFGKAAVKKLINDPADVVTEALSGVAAAHPDLRVDLENKIIYRADAPVQGKVGLLSGGGSGHEPLHGGFVGPGMLDAACPGEVFTSPVPDQMLEATRGIDGGAGVLHIVKNYTGDVMNF